MRLGDWTAREIEFLNNWLLLTAKPAVYLVNCSKKDYIRKKNKFLPKIFEWVQANGGAPIIPFSGVFENEVRRRCLMDHMIGANGRTCGSCACHLR